MNKANDLIHVGGSLFLQNKEGYDNDLSNGTLEAAGDVIVQSDYPVAASGYHKLLLNGNRRQTLQIQEGVSFHIVELSNYSEDGVYSETIFGRNELIRNNCKISYAGFEGEYGRILQEDTVVEGDLRLADDTLDLNGHTLTVTGDFIQTAGVVSVNKGKLQIGGDYLLQGSERQEDADGTVSGQEASPQEDTVLRGGWGRLIMVHEEDSVSIGGNFFMDSYASHENLLTAGVLEVKGNFQVSGAHSDRNFAASGNHTLLLSGEGEQKVSMEQSGGEGKNCLSHLEITNESEAGVRMEQAPCITGHVRDNGNPVSGEIIIRSSTTFEEDVYHGNVLVTGENVSFDREAAIDGNLYLRDAELSVSGTVCIGGSLTEDGGRTSVVMQRGSLTIEGDYIVKENKDCTAGLVLTHEEDYVHIRGNMEYNPYSSAVLQAGTVEIGGSLTSAKGIRATGNQRFLFSGSALQVIAVAPEEYFAIVELCNDSEEGVYSETVFAKRELIRNHTKLTYGSASGEYGWTLQEDTAWEGDLVLTDGVLDLNGYCLDISGDFIQGSGLVKINKGKLSVAGDYRIQTRTVEKPDDMDIYFSYGESSGYLQMVNPEDTVCIKGGFYSDSNVSHKGYLTAGMLEAGGDFVVSGRYCGDSFAASGSHKVVLNGDGQQKVSFGVSGERTSGLANLEILNTGGQGVFMDSENIPYVSGRVAADGNVLTGCVAIGSNTKFTENYCGASVFIGQNTVLRDKLIIGGDLLAGGLDKSLTLTIAGSVEVEGNYRQGKNTGLSVSTGSLLVKGGFEALREGGSTSGSIAMNDDNARICVLGDVSLDLGRISALQKGVFEVGGDFTSESSIYAGENHRFLFSGSRKQTISMTEDERFGIVELANTSEEGIFIERYFYKNELIQNGCRLTYLNGDGVMGWTLGEDTVHEGDLVLLDGTLDLNGHELRVTGDFIQPSGTVRINGGSLHIQGDYRLQSGEGEEGSYVYGRSGGGLVMQDGNDTVCVEGSFINETTVNHEKNLTAGVMEVRGDVTVTGKYGGDTYRDYSFIASENHTLLLSGTAKQTVTFEKSSDRDSRLANLEITNGSEEGVVFAEKVYAGGHVNDHGIPSGGYLAAGSSTTFENDTFNGNVYLTGKISPDKPLLVQGDVTAGNVQISSELTVTGNYIQEPGTVTEINQGSLIVQGSYEGGFSRFWAGGISMTHEEDYVHVYGNVNYKVGIARAFTAGTFEIGGDLSAVGTLKAQGDHTFIFSGEGKQTITVGEKDAFAVVELRNYSEEGVYSETPFARTRLIRNGCRLTYGSLAGSYGQQLEEDALIEGDFVLLEDELDLNGHTMTVTGDFIQAGGEVKINGGKLLIKGDYRIQNRQGSEGDYTYSAGSGRLVMENAEDRVNVEGDFIVQANSGGNGGLTEGVLEVKGNVTQLGGYAFKSSGDHTFVLSGGEKQMIYANASLSAGSLINRSTGGLVIGSDIQVSGTVSDEKRNISGTGSIILQNPEQVKDLYWSGSVKLAGETLLQENFTVGGILTVNSSLRMGRAATEASGIVLNAPLYVQGGSVRCTGDFTVADEGMLIMQEENGYVSAGGNFVMRSRYSHEGKLTEGVLELWGDFTQKQYVNFVAGGNHTVILARKRTTSGRNFVQTISFEKDAGTTRFHKLVLKKEADGYQFRNALETIADEVVYDIEDTTPPSGLKNLLVQKAGVCDITLFYDGGEDENGILGYEIYRDGEKVAVTGENTYTDRGLFPDTEYTYRVYPFDSYRNVALSSPEIKALTLPDREAPSIPEGAAMSARTGSSVTLEWKAASDNVGTDGYIVYRDGEELARTERTDYQDRELPKNTVCRYTVAAYDRAGNISAQSNEAEAVTALPVITETTPGDYESIGGEKINLRVYFTNVGNSTGNRITIEISDEEGRWEALTEAPVSQKTFDNGTLFGEYLWDITDMEGSRDCRLRYVVTDADDNRVEKEVTYYLDRQAPALPGNFKGEARSGGILLSWEPSVSADTAYYRLYRKEEDREYALLAEFEDSLESFYLDNAVEEGSSYSYVLMAGDACGNESGFTEAVTVQADKDTEPPKVKTMLPRAGRTGGQTDLIIEAQDNLSVNRVRLQYREEYSEEWQSLGETAYDMEKNRAVYAWDTTVLPDGVYFVRAVAADKAGNESTEEFTRRYEVDNTGIAKVTIRNYSVFATGVQLGWEDVQEEDLAFFQVEISPLEKMGQAIPEENFTVAATVSGILGCQIEDLQPGGRYALRVTGYDTLGNRGIPSDVVEVVLSEDTTAPIIEGVYPAQDCYRDCIPLEVRARDNYLIDRAVFSYSRDRENYTEIARVEAENPGEALSLSYDFDISSFEEGSLFVKFEVYDGAGNHNSLFEDGEEIVAEYRIDHTPPARVEGFYASSAQGCVALSWAEGAEDDIKGCRIYRARGDNGVYSLLEDCCPTQGYHDTDVKVGETYLYKVTAVDMAGNEGEASRELPVTVTEDTEKPLVTGMAPENKAVLGKDPVLKVLAMDNAGLEEILVEYRPDKEGQCFTEMGVIPAEGRSFLGEMTWNTEGLEEGAYLVRAAARDGAGNVSGIFESIYTLDLTPPETPKLTANTGHFAVDLEIKGGKEEDFDYYEIYRREPGGKKELLVRQETGTYTDLQITPYTVYLYQVAAYDTCGNVSWSAEAEGYGDDVDFIAPEAVLPENMTGLVGRELAFDGMGCSDNVRITEYVWDMGNGDVITGAQPVYTYDRAGEYTVTLEVRDAAGNKARAATQVHIYDKTGMGTTVVKVTDEKGGAIPFALVYVRTGENDSLSLKADSQGYVTVAAPVGVSCVAAYASGYLPEDKDIQISEYLTKEYTLALTRDELIVGELTARRMTLEEMADAGVDFRNPDNYHTYKFRLTLTFLQCPIPLDIEFSLNPFVSAYANLDTGKGGLGKERKSKIYLKLTDTPTEKKEKEEPILAYVITTQSVSWLKEMYQVELGVMNAADTPYVMEKCRATLNLPEEGGLSLAKINEVQFLEQKMGSIAGQGRKSATWIVKGDKSGKYKLSADFEGILMPFEKKVSAHFEAEEETDVQTGEGLHIYIYPEASAYIGEQYYIQFVVVNESVRPFYDFKTSIGKYTQGRYEYTVTDVDTGEVYSQIAEQITVTDPSRVSQSAVVRDGQTLVFNYLNPGDAYYGTYVTTFDAPGNPEEVYYRLISYLAEELEGENLGVEVSIIPVNSHIHRSLWKYVEVPVFFADPVDVTTGYFTEQVSLLSVSGASTLSFDIGYSSGAGEKAGELGYGWNHNYEMYLEKHNGVIKLYTAPEEYSFFIHTDALNGNFFGRSQRKNMILSEGESYACGKYQCLNGLMSDYVLTCQEDGTFVLAMPGGGQYFFDSAGSLTSIKDENGKSVSLFREESRTVIREDISGKQLYLYYNEAGRIVRVTDDNDRECILDYDDAGRLISLVNPEREVMLFSYDQDNNIVSESVSGSVTVSNVYDPEHRVISQKDACGNETAFSYTLDEQTEAVTIVITGADGSVRRTVVDNKGRIMLAVNENGSSTSYTYDIRGNVICERDGYGNCIFKEYDHKGNLLSNTDKGNLVTTMTYDKAGNVKTVTNAAGQTARYSYNEQRLVTEAVDYNGNTTEYTYDGQGLLTEIHTEGLGSVYCTYENGLTSTVTDYEGNITRFFHDGVGNLVKQVDALGGETLYTYDRTGRLLSATDPEGGVVRYTYDMMGNLLTETDALGNKTCYTYDPLSNCTEVVYPDGTQVSLRYDVSGNCTETVYEDGTASHYRYDVSGNLLDEILADGSSVSYTYDLLNQCTSETDSEGNTITYEYYPNGNLYRTTYPDGTYTLNTYNQAWKVISVRDRSGNVTSYEYDAMGNVTRERDPLGNEKTYDYDRAGRLVRETDARGNSTSYTYDKNSNCISKTNALGVTVHMEYDALGRMTAACTTDKDGAEYVIRYRYDALGRVVSYTDEEGNTTGYTYDRNGNVLTVTDPLGNVRESSSYDSMGRVIKTRDGSGMYTGYTYDSMGRLAETVEDADGSRPGRTQYSYDALGRLTDVKDALDGRTHASYDERGNLVLLGDAGGGTTRYRYDALGQMTEEISPLGGRRSYTYNAAGLPAEAVNANGQKTAYEYDAAGRITGMTDELGTVSYEYDANGNVVKVKDSRGTITRSYDALNRVTEYTDCRGNTVKYGYDELGNLISLTYPGGEIVRYTYYKNGWLHTVTDWEGHVTAYEYDGNGNPVKTLRPNGTLETCTYDKAGRLTGRKEVKDGEVLAEHTYSYDSRGNVETVTGTGAPGAGELSSVSMTYDAENRLITYNGESLRYDGEGNMTHGPVDGKMTELVYDCRNRLVKAGDTVYEYDAENNRISAEDGKRREEYVNDTVSSSLSRVLCMRVYEKQGEQGTGTPAGTAPAGTGDGTAGRENTGSGSKGSGNTASGKGTTTLYLYGNGLICEDTEGLYLYHHYNHLGSTVKLTDKEGRTVEEYTYGVYGELLSGNAALTRYLYNGRYGVSTDGNGLYYMRQRYYNPETRRFINRDIISGNLQNSQSLNRYSYVQGNPVSYTDPFGLSPLSSLFTGTGFAHAVLGLIGCVPGPVGMAANLVDAGIYAFVDHDPGMALLSLMGAASMGLGSVAKLAAGGGKLAKTARYMRTVCDLVSNTVNFARNASDFMATGYGMYEKYCIQGKEFNLREGSRELLQLGMSAAGCMIAGKGIGSETRKLAVMMQNDNVAGKIKAAIVAIHNDNRGCVDLSAFRRSKSGSSSRYYNPDGSPIWPPNRGFDGNPEKITLEPGTLIDRYGYDGGYFVSPKGIPYTERALPIGTDKKPYTVFEVVKPIEVQAGKIAPWFGEKGGGIQYEFNQTISGLLEQGILRKVQD